MATDYLDQLHAQPGRSQRAFELLDRFENMAICHEIDPSRAVPDLFEAVFRQHDLELLDPLISQPAVDLIKTELLNLYSDQHAKADICKKLHARLLELGWDGKVPEPDAVDLARQAARDHTIKPE